jgi:serine/threonine-protein kinase
MVTTPADAATAYRMAASTQVEGPARSYEQDGSASRRNGRDGQDGSQQRVWPWIVGILALLLIVGGGVAFYLLERTSTVAVPYVTGLDEVTAAQQLRTAGLSPDLKGPVYSNRKIGTVVSQNPTPGVHVARGSTVKLTPSGGPAPVEVPGVVGLSKSDAEQQLVAKKFKVKIHQESSKTIAAGNVISMNPAAGQQRPVGTVVTLNVSDGKPQVTVPSVVGEQVALATTALKGSNFQVSITPQVSTEPVGTVLNQDPTGNTKATYGATVVLTVAKAQPTVSVQSWVGGLASDALSALRRQGFVVIETFTNVRFPSKDGIVLHQHPRTGNLKKGSTVRIVVGQYVAPPVTTTTSSSTRTTTTTSSSTTTTTTSSSTTTTTGAPAGAPTA